MNKNNKITAIICAILAAVFYALNTPFSKVLLKNISPTFMAAFLYLGAGIGVGIMYLFKYKNEDKDMRLTKNDLTYTILMVVLDVIAPIFLMIGISIGSSANASLLGNFEIVATSIIALVIFKEDVSKNLWIAIVFITLSSIILSFEGQESFRFSYGSLFVILATMSWGLENNCTRKISNKSSYQIVTIKGLCSGIASLIISIILGEKFPEIRYTIYALLLGYVAYGLSIFLYVRSQRDLGAAKTSAYYAIAPFIGTFLCFLVNGEALSASYFAGLILMIVGTVFVVIDTCLIKHTHLHTHTITHTHDGYTHTHVLTHEHEHKHFLNEDKQGHNDFLSSEEHMRLHKNNL
ncbi:EamA family transporter [Peptostreptococcaceae bacterium oral taxon 929]|nr:EamA family transporter [Peptostreptococcaceae bacterium oral taxon 929]